MYIHSCASRKIVPRTFEFQHVSVDMTIFKLQKPIPHPPFLKSMMADFCHWPIRMEEKEEVRWVKCKRNKQKLHTITPVSMPAADFTAICNILFIVFIHILLLLCYNIMSVCCHCCCTNESCFIHFLCSSGHYLPVARNNVHVDLLRSGVQKVGRNPRNQIDMI